MVHQLKYTIHCVSLASKDMDLKKNNIHNKFFYSSFPSLLIRLVGTKITLGLCALISSRNWYLNPNERVAHRQKADCASVLCMRCEEK